VLDAPNVGVLVCPVVSRETSPFRRPDAAIRAKDDRATGCAEVCVVPRRPGMFCIGALGVPCGAPGVAIERGADGALGADCVRGAPL
jgi:hypothetical protein